MDFGDIFGGPLGTPLHKAQAPAEPHDWDWSKKKPTCRRCALVWEAGASPQQVQQFLMPTCKGIFGLFG